MAEAAVETVPVRIARPWLSPLNQRRLHNFRANRRGYWSLWIFLVLFVLSLFSEFIANDKPIIASYKGEILFPVLVAYPEEKFGGFYAVTDYRDPVIQEEINANGWMIWPPVRYSYQTVNNAIPEAAPTKPSWLYDAKTRCNQYPQGAADPNCNVGNWNWLGTDDQARDVLARVIYGFRISVLFGLILTFGSALIGVAAGAVQGYFGGWTDLLFQRFIEIWSAIPVLYLLLIVAAILPPGFFILLGLMLLFSWVALVGVVRAEFLPFLLSGSISTLTSLDYLGFGLPPGSASLGELLKQAQRNLNAPWLGISGFVVISLMLSLLVFVGEATRDAFDPRKAFR
jgi:microcin C transport system permease protein